MLLFGISFLELVSEKIDLAKNLTSLLILLSQVQSSLNINNPFSVHNSTGKFTTLFLMSSGQRKETKTTKAALLADTNDSKYVCINTEELEWNAKICSVWSYVLCASCYQGGRSRCCLNDSNALFEIIATKQEKFENIFMCLHADVYTYTQWTVQTSIRTWRHHLTFLPVQWYRWSVPLKILYLPWKKTKPLSEKDWGVT